MRAGQAEHDPSGTHSYEGLAPGRYRVFERGARQPSDVVEVDTGGLAELTFDLSRDEGFDDVTFKALLKAPTGRIYDWKDCPTQCPP